MGYSIVIESTGRTTVYDKQGLIVLVTHNHHIAERYVVELEKKDGLDQQNITK